MTVFDKPAPSSPFIPLPKPSVPSAVCINSLPPEVAPPVFKDKSSRRHSSIFLDSASGVFLQNSSVPIIDKPWNVLVNAPSRGDLGAGAETKMNSIHAVGPPACGYQGTKSLQSNFVEGPPVQSVNSGMKRKQQVVQAGNYGTCLVSRTSGDVLDLPGKFVILELCGGSARLTKAFFNAGCDAFSIDWKRNASKPEGPSVLMDLCCPVIQAFLLKLTRTGRVKYIHAGPPCGTASRARDRPVPARLKALGAPEPKPLRSQSSPLGLPHLKGTDLLKVQLANQLYSFISVILSEASFLGALWSVENPYRSWYWQIPFVQALLKLENVSDTIFPNCIHGGTRPKITRLRHNVATLCRLEGTCPGESKVHIHEPWGIRNSEGRWKFDTALEAAYPSALCKKICDLVFQQWKDNGIVLPSPKCPVSSKAPRLADLKPPNLTKAESGRQARGSASPIFLPEYEYVAKLSFQLQWQLV